MTWKARTMSSRRMLSWIVCAGHTAGVRHAQNASAASRRTSAGSMGGCLATQRLDVPEVACIKPPPPRHSR